MRRIADSPFAPLFLRTSGADLSRRKPGDPPPDSVEQTADLVVQLVTGMRVSCEKPVIAGIGGLVAFWIGDLVGGAL